MIHKSEWVISMADGFPLFHPPPWVGDRPLRNLIHRPDLIAHPIGPRPATPVARLDDLDPTPDLRCPVEEFSAFDPREVVAAPLPARRWRGAPPSARRRLRRPVRE
jgi:hypothetical protein